MRKFINFLPISRADAAKVANVLGSIPMREIIVTTLSMAIIMVALPFALLAFSAHEAWM
jgi:hypothetical protein